MLVDTKSRQSTERTALVQVCFRVQIRIAQFQTQAERPIRGVDTKVAMAILALDCIVRERSAACAISASDTSIRIQVVAIARSAFRLTHSSSFGSFLASTACRA